MDSNYQFLIQQLGKHRVCVNEPMAQHTTFKIGGPADLFYEAHTTNELINAVELCEELKIPLFILGGGSNILVSDGGIRGLVIHNRASGIKILGIKGKISKKDPEPVEGPGGQISEVFLEADAGVMLNRLVRYTLEEGLAGLEVFLGLPGTVGGAVTVNAHFRASARKVASSASDASYRPQNNEFIRNFLAQVKILKDGKIYDLSSEEFLKEKTKHVLLSCVFKLLPGKKNFLWQKAQEAMEHRTQTQPLNMPSAGCIFKNINPTTSTGYLIDQTGLKSIKIGGAKISEVHANFIVNMGGAKAQDVVELIKKVKEKVREKFGIELKEEIEYMGDF